MIRCSSCAARNDLRSTAVGKKSSQCRIGCIPPKGITVTVFRQT